MGAMAAVVIVGGGVEDGVRDGVDDCAGTDVETVSDGEGLTEGEGHGGGVGAPYTVTPHTMRIWPSE